MLTYDDERVIFQPGHNFGKAGRVIYAASVGIGVEHRAVHADSEFCVVHAFTLSSIHESNNLTDRIFPRIFFSVSGWDCTV